MSDFTLVPLSESSDPFPFYPHDLAADFKKYPISATSAEVQGISTAGDQHSVILETLRTGRSANPIARAALQARKGVQQHVRKQLFYRAWHEFVCDGPKRTLLELLDWAGLTKEQFDANRRERDEMLRLFPEVEIPWRDVYFYGSDFDRGVA